MKTRIHVNQHNIRSNKTKDTDLPVITIKQGRKNTYCNEVEILGLEIMLLFLLLNVVIIP
jgi:hypothetical protein